MATDDFERPNESLDASANWTERNGDWEVVSNQAGCPTTSANDACAKYDNTGLSSADYYVQAVVTPPSATNSLYFGVVGRQADYSTSDSDGYMVFIRATSNTVYLYKQVSNSYTLLDSASVGTINASPYTVKLSMDGSSLEGFFEGTSYVTATDTDLTAKGHGGMLTANAGIALRWDDYEQDNLAAGGTTILPLLNAYHG